MRERHRKAPTAISRIVICVGHSAQRKVDAAWIDELLINVHVEAVQAACCGETRIIEELVLVCGLPNTL